MHDTDLRELARGRWTAILPAMGVDARYLSKKHGPCPFCGGIDRYRFTDQNGEGRYYCNQCGPGDGFDLFRKLTGKKFPELKQYILQNAGRMKPVVEKVDLEECRRAAADRWKNGRLPTPDGPVWRYIEGRIGIWPHLVSEIRQYDGNLIARITGPDGKGVNIQTIELRVEGGKVIRGDKKVMKGTLPKGSAVRLFLKERVLGIAEGIETAISATRLFGVPCWSVISTVGMINWIPPEDVETIVVYGDNDENYAGESAAYSIANKLVTQFHKKVEVRIPPIKGWDWNDALKTSPQFREK